MAVMIFFQNLYTFNTCSFRVYQLISIKKKTIKKGKHYILNLQNLISQISLNFQ